MASSMASAGPLRPPNPRFISGREGYGPGRTASTISLTTSRHNSVLYDKFNLEVDPRGWEASKEPDDDLHDPRAPDMVTLRAIVSARGIRNVGCLVVVLLAILTLFIGYPLKQFLTDPTYGGPAALNTVDPASQINSTGQLPESAANLGVTEDEERSWPVR